MPDRLEVQDVACPAGTTTANPVEVVLSNVVACQVVKVTIRIPPGHAGLTGLALGYGHNAVIPRTANRYISGDDEVIEYDLTHYPPGPQWQAFLINTDTQAHAWEIRFEVDELAPPPAGAPSATVIPVEDLYAGAGQIVGIG